MKSPLIIIGAFALLHSALAQNTSLIGARANGMAYASACLADEWSLFNNPAGLVGIKSLTTSFTYDARPSLKSFNRMAVGISNPFKSGVAAFGICRFGDDLYNEHLLSAGFSNQFGLASLGLSVNYLQYQAEGFGTKGVLTVSFGGIAHLTPTFSIGAHIVNINQPEISQAQGDRVPARLVVGLAFNPTEKIFITTAVDKDIDYPLTWKTALEYLPHKKVAFRTGYAIQPNAAFFGFGFMPDKFLLDYAFQYNPDTHDSHQASIGYQFSKKKK